MFGIGMSKAKEQKEKKRVSKVIEDVRTQAQVLNSMVDFVNDFGNMNKRKKHKMRHSDFVNIRNQILQLPVSLNVAMAVINQDKKLLRDYNKLMAKVEIRLKQEIEEARKRQLQSQVNKIIGNHEA